MLDYLTFAMKTKYLFIHCTGQVDETTLFVTVYVGSSEQDQRDKRFLSQLAQSSTDYYLERYLTPQADFMQAVDASLQVEMGDERARALRCEMPVAKLRRLIKSGLYEDWARRFYQAFRNLRRLSLSANSAYSCAIFRADSFLTAARLVPCNAANVINLSKQIIEL